MSMEAKLSDGFDDDAEIPLSPSSLWLINVMHVTVDEIFPSFFSFSRMGRFYDCGLVSARVIAIEVIPNVYDTLR